MQRSLTSLAIRHAGLLAPCSVLLSTPKENTVQHTETEQFVKDFKMVPMASHNRSSFEYKGSTKGAEVGARNEAAFMNYEEFTPKTLTGKFAMPGLINLLSISPIYCALLCFASAAWGIFYWDLYCRKNYETVLIARPVALK